MSREPTWNWLAPRSTLNELRQAAAESTPTDARPCLPTIEPLDDRVLLSAAPASSEEGQTTSAGILIGLLKGTVGVPGNAASLLSNELGMLKLAAYAAGNKLNPDLGIKLSNALAGINDVTFKLAEAEIDGEAKDKDHKDWVALLDQQTAKLDAAVANLNLSPDNNVLPAVQLVEDNAEGILIGLLKGGPATDVSTKGFGNNIYLKLADTFNDFADKLVGVGSTIIFSKADDQQKLQDYQKYRDYLKLNKLDVQVQDSKVAEFQQQLQTFVNVANDLAKMLLAPTTDGGGLSLLKITGDVITP